MAVKTPCPITRSQFTTTARPMTVPLAGTSVVAEPRQFSEKIMATINGIDLQTARIRGEMCNATDYTRAAIPAYILVDRSEYSWLDGVQQIVIHITLRQGYGSESHLFDRAAATIAAATEGRLYTSAWAAKAAAKNVHVRESLGYAVEVETVPGRSPVPVAIEADAEAIRSAIAAKANAAKYHKLRKALAALQVLPHNGKFVVGTQANLDASFPCAYAFARAYPPASGFCSPIHYYDTEAEALADLASFRAEVAE